MTLKIYTSVYSYKGDDRLDITVKGNDPIGKTFSPTWDMVNKYKSNRYRAGAKVQYMKSYHSLMLQSYKDHRDVWEEVLNRDRVTLVCFCRTGFCHRLILKDYFVKLGGIYKGEIGL